jgi:hypothetical protein
MSKAHEAIANTLTRGLPYEAGLAAEDIIGVDYHVRRGGLIPGNLHTEGYARFALGRAAAIGLIEPGDVETEPALRVRRGELLRRAPIRLRVGMHHTNLWAPIAPSDPTEEELRQAGLYRHNTVAKIGRIMTEVDEGDRYPDTQVVIYLTSGNRVDDNILADAGSLIVVHRESHQPLVFTNDGLSPPLPDGRAATTLANQVDLLFDDVLKNDANTEGHFWVNHYLDVSNQHRAFDARLRQHRVAQPAGC